MIAFDYQWMLFVSPLVAVVFTSLAWWVRSVRIRRAKRWSQDLAARATVQLAYAIGVAEPVSVHVDTNGTGRISNRQVELLVRECFGLTPAAIIESLDLRRPIYRKTAANGHFGSDDPDFTWERTDRAETLREAAGIGVAAPA